jgi:hypothetical protein
MKKLFCFVLFMGFSFCLQDQFLVNGKNINELDIEYIELIVDQRLFNQGQVYAIIDYGQTIRISNFRQNRIQDAQGTDKLFGSKVDIFNFLFRNGWIHDLTYSVESYEHHIFRRKP